MFSRAPPPPGPHPLVDTQSALEKTMLRRPLTGTALLYLALLGSKQAQASQDLAGDYIHIYYGDLGLWFDEAASAGFQANLDGSWADFVATGTADPYVFAGVQYTKSSTTYDFYAGFDTDFFADADWTVTSEEDLSDSDRLWSRYEWEIGDVTVVKDEKWEPAERTMLVTFTVTNNATTDLDTFQLVDIVDADDPSGSSTMTCDTRDQDGDGVKDWAESRGRTSNYTIGFGLCNPNAQEVGHDSYPADFSELEITDFAAARGDYNLVFLHTADLIEAGDTVNFGFIVAIGDTPSEARTAYEAAIELCYDLDEDGFENELGAGDDCDDTDSSVNPDEEEIWYDGWDQDCGQDDDYDADGDGYVPDEYEGLPTYDAGGDVVEGTGTGTAGDCDDNNADTNPEADEIWYDGLDEDCDGGDDYDADGDGYVPEEYEGLPTYDGDGEAIPGTGDLPSDDCDDDNANTNPESEDTWYDGVDSDCGEDDDYDADGDGYVPDEYEGLPTYDPGTGDEIDGTGEAPGGDCDDHDPDIGPGVEETWYDGVDSDCGEDDDYDADGDGYAAEGYDGLPTYDASGDEIEGTGDLPGDDCNDADADINPGATEIWYDGVDQDCDDNDNDADGDGHGHEGFGGDDCDDTDVSIWATEDCGTEGFYKGGGGATCATAVSRGSWWLGALALLGLARRRRR